ncbi:hypothetical protein JQ599_28520 [Bradyrhizobium diazoefficiens]|nr:hypothetical protein [Bradyrhizobium diazoefficiens]MBR0703881.1 hypothetical protein [Bradyrhizobium diazoefficiens]MBR0770496.1 hypothetical protein [Bradyrhizobium diazoefficiens]
MTDRPAAATAAKVWSQVSRAGKLQIARRIQCRVPAAVAIAFRNMFGDNVN